MSRRHPSGRHPRRCKRCKRVRKLFSFKAGRGPEGHTTTCLDCYRDAYAEALQRRDVQVETPTREHDPKLDEAIRRLRQNVEDILGG